jgi:hypothetical protein
MEHCHYRSGSDSGAQENHRVAVLLEREATARRGNIERVSGSDATMQEIARDSVRFSLDADTVDGCVGSA